MAKSLTSLGFRQRVWSCQRGPEQLSRTRNPLPSYPYGASLSTALPGRQTRQEPHFTEKETEVR